VLFINNNKILTGGIDKNIYILDLEGKILHHRNTTRVRELLVSNDSEKIVAISAGIKNKVLIFDLESMKETFIQEMDTVISMCLTIDSLYLLLNTSFTKPELHLWKMDRKEIVGK